MKLITKVIERKLEKNPLYSGEDIPLEDKKILVKFFTPWSNWTWFVTEAERLEDGDWRFFGLVHGIEKEWGYFMFSELQSLRGPWGLKVERDRNGPKFIREVL
jgi:hypothetical protein